LEEFVLGKDQDWSVFVMNAGKELMLSAAALPGEMKKFITRAMHGEMEVRLKGLNEHARLLYALGHQVIYALFAIAGSVFWMVLDGRGQFEQAKWAGWAAATSGGLMILSFLSNRNRRRRRR
jgi:hypothetical protein